ncbi:MAG: hypothetical protein KKB81_05285 [Candidatus Margulisbacteria bacterium]|nr:hypothetical protein [Candidatus Margulisiibacteriota bacterium]MBU1021327.1 hypothetical protein [Candidatus Margulisiibacteriota bacterium]MBU1729184.1 hypothetical protein [Candidatus Margulisiibacteriota bacterium]MBU1767818.1 hypothetical protein [Candidatus Omnitrophota bacterium]MBU1954857.1 hypothetical protein [Candidatus Margulisiibacteriota bacterium]
MLKKLTLILIIIIAAVTLFGCARTVTNVITYGNSMSVIVTFRGNIDFFDNSYFMVISSQEAFQIPYDPYEPYEFIEPGLPPTDPTLDYYQFYRTWDGYVILDSSGSGLIWLVRGPFNSTAESYADYTRVQIGEVTTGSDQWTFDFDLSQLYGTNVPVNIYFDFVSVSESTSRLQDHLDSNGQIQSYTDSTASDSNSPDTDIDASLDITRYSVTIN